MCLNGTERLRKAIWCEIYVIREGYIPYLKQFARQRDQKEVESIQKPVGKQKEKKVDKTKEEKETIIATRKCE